MSAKGISRTIQVVGETRLTGKNQISLPAQGVRQLGWQRGDHLLVEVLGGSAILLVRRPAKWAEAFAGQLSDVFGDHADTLRYLEQERRGWE